MIKNTAILFLLFLGRALGDEHFDRGVLRVLNEANQQKIINGSGALCLPLTAMSSTSRPKFSTREMNECVFALCGSPDENKGVYITDKNFGQYVSPEIKKKLASLEPDLKKVIAKENSKNIKLLNGLKVKINDPHPQKWSTEYRKELSYKMFAPYLQEQIDLKKPINERFNIRFKDDKNLSPELREQLVLFKEKYSDFVKSDVNSFLERGLYSEDEQKQIARSRLKKLQKDQEKAAPLMNKFEKEDVSNRINSSLEEIDQLKGEDLSLALINMSNLEVQVHSYLPDQNYRPQRPSCEGGECDQSLKNYIKNAGLVGSIEKAKNEIRNPAMSEQQLNQCRAKIVAKLSNVSDKKNAEKLVSEVKKEISKNVFSKFSAHSRKILEDYFQKNIVTGNESLAASFTPNKAYDEFRILIDSGLNDDFEGFDLSEEEALSRAFSLMENDQDPTEGTGVCSPKMDSNAYDTYLSYEKVKEIGAEAKKLLSKLPPKDHIFISPFSCHHDLRGKSVVAHELGHAINQIFASVKLSESSSKAYKKIRKCSTDNYTEFVPDRVQYVHEGDAIRTEEDTADVFAYMTYPDNSDLFSCALIKPTLDNRAYDELSFLNDDGDTHSTSLYRLINEAINKKRELPISCQSAIEPMKDQLRLKKCAP